MTTLWRKLQVPSKLDLYKFEKVYRTGTTVPTIEQSKLSLSERIRESVQKVSFLEVCPFYQVHCFYT
ncbi:conserved hypothetical protein [Theileria equi strain WA]|uniref:Uncharacterized protein n=1 Tax=Theileria equi strain WA TaxID=1537102 RepID=L1LCW9_THEEQ|nr:conserved hypothetical protein [Theileria equi strain WA]EKX73100.1 conserved hypothetical protein [Theileria equi strain WA]|eukprot:XP_004832552.1 conserved hypothetical protein [Theileria equi strain WA]